MALPQTSLLVHAHFWTLRSRPAPGAGAPTGQGLAQRLSGGGSSAGAQKPLPLGIHTYREKARRGLKLSGSSSSLSFVDDDVPYAGPHAEWAEKRGEIVVPSNDAPKSGLGGHKLRDSLRACEEALASSRPVNLRWHGGQSLCSLLIDDGTTISFAAARHNGDVERMLVDTTLTGKLEGRIFDSVSFDRVVISSHATKSQLSLVQLFPKRPMADVRKLSKLSGKDPRVAQFDMAETAAAGNAHAGARLTVSSRHEFVAAWWSEPSDQRAFNVALLRIVAEMPKSSAPGQSGEKVVVNVSLSGISMANPPSSAATYKLVPARQLDTGASLLDLSFSSNHPRMLYAVLLDSDGVTLRHRVYECIEPDILSFGDAGAPRATSATEQKVRLQPSADSTVTLPSAPVSMGRSHAEDRLAILCADGSLLMYDDESSSIVARRSTDVRKAAFLRWHTADELLLVCTQEDGAVRFFDRAANPIGVCVSSESPQPTPSLRLADYLPHATRLDVVEWSRDPLSAPGGGDGAEFGAMWAPNVRRAYCYDTVMLVFDRGPIVVLRMELGMLSRGCLGASELVAERLCHGEWADAVALATDGGWARSPEGAISCLFTVVDTLISQPHTAEIEALVLRALDVFWSPRSRSAQMVAAKFRPSIVSLYRLVFSYLLRNRRLDRAFFIATRLAACDLFMEVYVHAAVAQEFTLASLALEQAKATTVHVSLPSPPPVPSDDSADEGDDERANGGDPRAATSEAPGGGNRPAPVVPLRPVATHVARGGERLHAVNPAG